MRSAPETFLSQARDDKGQENRVTMLRDAVWVNTVIALLCCGTRALQSNCCQRGRRLSSLGEEERPGQSVPRAL